MRIATGTAIATEMPTGIEHSIQCETGQPGERRRFGKPSSCTYYVLRGVQDRFTRIYKDSQRAQLPADVQCTVAAQDRLLDGR